MCSTYTASSRSTCDLSVNASSIFPINAAFALFDKQKTETIWQSVSPAEKIYISLFITPRPIIIELLPSVCTVCVPCSIITINNRGNEWCAFEAAGWAWKKCEAWNKTYLRWSVIKVIIDWYVYTYYGVVTIATHRVMRRPGPVLLPRRAVSPMRWMRLNVVNYITPDRTLWKTIRSIENNGFCSAICVHFVVATLFIWDISRTNNQLWENLIRAVKEIETKWKKCMHILNQNKNFNNYSTKPQRFNI